VHANRSQGLNGPRGPYGPGRPRHNDLGVGTKSTGAHRRGEAARAVRDLGRCRGPSRQGGSAPPDLGPPRRGGQHPPISDIAQLARVIAPRRIRRGVKVELSAERGTRSINTSLVINGRRVEVQRRRAFAIHIE
jgi:hypothetical protein